MKLLDQKLHKGLDLDQLKTNFYGIEIECEGYNGVWQWTTKESTALASYTWNLVSDPSLRQGIEFVSKKLSQIGAG